MECASCHENVLEQLTGTCTACGKAVCYKCGTILSVHFNHETENQLGQTRTYDEEVSRTGSCSFNCAHGPVMDALVSCLLDDLRQALKDAGVKVDNSHGMYGPEFVLSLPGLPGDIVDSIKRYCQAEGPNRMPYRHIVKAMLANPHLIEVGSDGSTKVFVEAADSSEYVMVFGSRYVLETAEAASVKGPSSNWTDLWNRSIKGIAQVLSVSGRFEDAAKVYETGGFFEEAGAERAKASRSQAGGLDIASLLKKFRRSGMVSAFRCPSCGAAIRVAKDTPEAKLHVCEYCGTAIKDGDVTDFLMAILGAKE
jgi:predicted RNA-binding Zn-ribbon protein involved in translation (DUF1610 family)